jgi:protocadherin alpha
MFKNNYTHWQILDYPSMHHIAEKVRDNKFNIVFSVDEKVKQIYDTLAKIIGTTARIADLKDDDNTIVQLIDDVYKSIRSSVEMRIEKIPDNINIELFSSCMNRNYIKTSKCTFKGKPTITFDAKISMNSCPKDKSMWNQTIKIGIQTK